MLEYKGYLGNVEFDDEADLFHGEVIGIRDVVTFQGRSVGELRAAFQESVDDYLEFCRQRGEQPDKPCSGRFVVRLSPDLHRRLTLLAAATGRSLNTCVAECLDREVGEQLQIVKK
ncbi:MAG: type II toxin-antitoxin system HicB family antitoxin [Pirellulales bacterium]|nr:type II toxin-antitoxin system HicB family antitoxin [Pirellulales bacterium]